MINSIPFFGWFLDFCVKASLSVPFYAVWTYFGIGEKYFYFLPQVYLRPTFWDCVGVFIVVPILKSIFVPRLVSVSNKQEVKTEKPAKAE